MQDLLWDGKTLYVRRLGVLFTGPVIPFGAMVEYHPISDKDLFRLHSWICAACGRRNWNRLTHLKSIQKDSMQMKCGRL